jgi:hypothetical protein
MYPATEGGFLAILGWLLVDDPRILAGLSQSLSGLRQTIEEEATIALGNNTWI